MNDLTHHGRSVFKDRVPDLRLRHEPACAFPLEIGRFQLAVQLIGRKERRDWQKIRCLWINSGPRSEQSSRMEGLGAQKTYEKKDENMVY